MDASIIDYIPLAKSLAYKHFYSLDVEEKLQESYLGLVLAKEAYDEKIGTTFATFAINVIMNRLRILYRKEIKIDYIDVDEIEIQDVRNEIEKLELRIAVQQTITKIEYKVLEYIYMKDYTQEECAKAMGTTQSTISKTLNRSLNKLKNQM
ncbi:MAG TPA: sigma-70 family RNA polymerase sigma factor [Candidatus Paceibacterota bacterium]|nr:sigma-70 family RNA polymerase sigma factor [Candidatus Paceibacterota bacterium]